MSMHTLMRLGLIPLQGSPPAGRGFWRRRREIGGATEAMRAGLEWPLTYCAVGVAGAAPSAGATGT